MKARIEKLEAALTKLEVDLSPMNIAVAISGGGDSMALVLLMNELVKQKGGRLLALTVEHGLREGSLAEAEGVNKILSDLGIEHRILEWQGEKPTSRIEEKAREARYKLLLEECNKENIEYLSIAHNIEDLVETFWIRLSHGSGLDGLSSIAPIREEEGVKIIRPLLDFTREELRDVCRDANIEWFEDPSNKDEAILRVKLRKFEDMLAGEGLTPDRLVKVINKLEDSRESLEVFTNQAMGEVVEYSDLGFVRIDLDSFKTYPKDIQRRILANSLHAVYPQKYKTGFDLLEDTRQEILVEGFKGKTLSGCEIFPEKSGGLYVSREYARIDEVMPLTDAAIWDNRCKITSPENLGEYQVKALGDEGLKILRKEESLKDKLEYIPYKIKLAIPAIWQDAQLISVPNLGYNLDVKFKDTNFQFFE